MHSVNHFGLLNIKREEMFHILYVMPKQIMSMLFQFSDKKSKMHGERKQSFLLYLNVSRRSYWALSFIYYYILFMFIYVNANERSHTVTQMH